MQINRLHPPATQPTALPHASPALAGGAGGTANGTAAEGGAGVGAGSIQRAAPPLLTNPINKPALAANEGVRVEINSASRAANAGLYTKAGIVPSRMPAMLQTPAEQFVNSAVNIMRDFEANAAASPNGSAQAASRAAAAAFGSLQVFKQAVARLNVFA